ncbi:MAG: hypothetical protein WCS83_04545 [Endomicrobiia bacterium]
MANDVYCSTELYNNFEEIEIERNVNELYIRDLYGKNGVSKEVFSNYIKQNDIKCLIIDSYTYNKNVKITFLEPDNSYLEWGFYKKSITKTVLYFIEATFFVLGGLLLFLIINLILYYKVILYIIFGSIKSKDTIELEKK